jgi:LAO/AO transport system kinase
MHSAAPAEDLLAGALRGGERRALAKAITLVESTLPADRRRAAALLDTLMPHTGTALRLGISGVPGVGKSTFIEAFGMHLVRAGKRVAVLAVDPSSSVHGGSILGDKTRMDILAQSPQAFIRPSPASGALGGVTHSTREALLLCEAAGYDVVIVETVGVGQSEAAVAGMCDVFLVLQLPNAGDELQALKKGMLELADIVVYNKADIDAHAADLACGQMRSALHLLRPASKHWQVPVLQTSALRNTGIDTVWETILAHSAAARAAGEFDARRQRQSLAWTWNLVEHGLQARFRANPAVQARLGAVLEQVAQGALAPASAALRLLDAFQSGD